MVRSHSFIFCMAAILALLLLTGFNSNEAAAQIITNVTSFASPEYSAAPALVDQATSFGDRNYYWTNIPPLLQGVEYVLTANDDRGQPTNPLFTITISQAATVYLLWNDNVALEPWASGYTDTGDNLTNINPSNPGTGDRTYSVYSQSMAAGTINFGPQTNGTDRIYAVAVSASGPPPAASSAGNWMLYR